MQDQSIPEDLRRPAVILFSDIVGYSKMMHEDEKATLEFLSVHNALIEGEVKTFGGRVVKTIGDAFMVEFAAASEAVLCAASIQKKLEEYNVGKPRKSLIRIGIHAGSVSVDKDNDLFGGAVNISARLEPKCQPGAICVSKEVFDQVKGGSGLSFQTLGALSLKNIATPIEVFLLFPTAESQQIRAELQRRRKYRRMAVASGWLLVIACLAAAAVFLPAKVRAWKEEHSWKPWLVEDFKDREGFERRWSSRVHDLDPGRGQLTLLENTILAHTIATLPRQSFRMRVYFTVKDLLREFDPSFAVVAASSLTTVPSAVEIHHFQDLGTGFVGYQDFKQGLLFSGEGQRRSVAPFTVLPQGVYVSTAPSPFKTGAAHLQVTLTYENDILRFEAADGRTLETLIGGMENGGGNDLSFGFLGTAVAVERVEIAVKKRDQNVDLITAADNYRLQGKTELAVNIYDDLVERSEGAEQKCRFLYKKATAFWEAHEEAKGLQAYREIIEKYPDNLYSGYTRYALAEFYEEQGLNLGQLKGLGPNDLSREQGMISKKYYDDLLSHQPEHPKSRQTHNMALQNIVFNLGDLGAGEAMAKQLIESQSEPQVSNTLNLLVLNIYLSKAWPDAEKPGTALAYLDGLISRHGVDSYLGWEAESTKLRVLNLFHLNEALFAEATLLLKEGKLSGIGRSTVYYYLGQLADDPGTAEGATAWLTSLEQDPDQARFFYHDYQDKAWSAMISNRAATYLNAQKALRPASIGASFPERLDWQPVAGQNIQFFGQDPQKETKVSQSGEIDFFYLGVIVANFHHGIGMRLFLGPKAGESADLSGFGSLHFEANVPMGAPFSVVLAEDGVDDPMHQGSSEADGEEYSWTRGGTGTGSWQPYSIPFEDLEPRQADATSPSNLRGNNIVDLQAMIRADVVISQWKDLAGGELKVRNVSFARK